MALVPTSLARSSRVEFSGERYIPKEGDEHLELAIEHRLRYLATQPLVAGKRVLDAACGEGYGSALFAEGAATVHGIDISDEAIVHAKRHYARSNLTFTKASIEKLPFPDHSFDVVVSFETIEHVDERIQRAFLREVKRVLAPSGTFVISTPDKRVYSDESNHKNTWHVREFYRDEFDAFLREEFAFVDLYGQQALVAMSLRRPQDDQLRVLETGRSTTRAKYLIAVCSNAAPVDQSIAGIALDGSGAYEAMWKRIIALQDEVESRNRWAQQLLDERAALKASPPSLEREFDAMQRTIAGRDEELRQKWSALLSTRIELQVLRSEHEKLTEQHQQLVQAHSAAAAELAMHRGSVAGKVYLRYRSVRDRALPINSPQREILKKGYRGVAAGVRSVLRRRGAPAPVVPAPKPAQPEPIEPFSFPHVDDPVVSIIIPVFNHWATTYTCLRSLHATLGDLPAEIILADDGSSDETRRAGEIVAGMTIIADGTNRGFLRNCNNAAGFARGRYIYFLNNDTEVKAQAVQALVELLDAEPRTGLVGSKLIYPDGRLQEAGGIIWKDASGWNFGRLQDPDSAEFNYVRDVDYISGASIMVRASLWREIGGFDERYAPAYCEDSDFAFEVRKRGYGVRYQPRSVVVHYEGVSNGTDTSTGIKAYQVRNSNYLREKWRTVLERDHLPPGEDVFVARDRSRNKPCILVIDHYVPHFDKDAGSRTVWAFLRALIAMGFQVKFIGDNFFQHEPYTSALQQAGIEVLHGPKYSQGWEQWLADNGRFIDVVLLNRPHIGPKYLAAIRATTKAKVLYYGHDLEYLREAKRAEVENDDELRRHAEALKLNEQQTMSRMDVVLTCSHSEAVTIRELCPGVQVECVPPYALDVDRAALFSKKERSGLLFVGGFSHRPNVDAVVNFMREAWPAIERAIPGVVFTIAGSNPSPEVLALASENVHVLGFVSDAKLLELYRTARLTVVPLRYGAGVKGKTVEAMAYGVPVVGTPIAFEGMEDIASYLHPLQQAEPMHRAVIELYDNDVALKSISARQREFVQGRFSLDAIAAAFSRAIGGPQRQESSA